MNGFWTKLDEGLLLLIGLALQFHAHLDVKL